MIVLLISLHAHIYVMGSEKYTFHFGNFRKIEIWFIEDSDNQRKKINISYFEIKHDIKRNAEVI